MCVTIEVILPILERFLLLYSLRCGCILVLFWTTIRSLFCVVFFSSAILEALIGKKSLFGGSLASGKQETQSIYAVYYTLIILMLCDTIVLVFMIHLAIGLFCCSTQFLEHYLLCRFFAFLIEIIGLVVLCFTHKLLIGWYLGILFFVFLELYSFIVVYSYYVQMLEAEKES